MVTFNNFKNFSSSLNVVFPVLDVLSLLLGVVFFRLFQLLFELKKERLAIAHLVNDQESRITCKTRRKLAEPVSLPVLQHLLELGDFFLFCRFSCFDLALCLFGEKVVKRLTSRLRM